MLRRRLAADHCYILDRWYAQFQLFDEIHAIGSSYVCRIPDNSSWQVIEQRTLSAEASAANVAGNALVELGSSYRPNHRVRVVLVKTTPNLRRGGRHGGGAAPSSDGLLRIATNLLDVPAELIAEIYRHRWTIELYFCFFKHVLGCRHLLSQDRVGIEIQTYCAIIACLLISLTTGCKPTLRTYEMVCLYLQGWADEDELTSAPREIETPHRLAALSSTRAAAAPCCATWNLASALHSQDRPQANPHAISASRSINPRVLKSSCRTDV